MNNHTIDAIFFDWDGVIVDSMRFVAAGIRETAASFGVAISSQDVLENYIQPKEMYYRSIGVDMDSDPNELTKRHLAFIEKNDKPVLLYPEVLQVLKALQGHGYQLGIVSSRSKEEVIRERNRLQLSQFF